MDTSEFHDVASQLDSPDLTAAESMDNRKEDPKTSKLNDPVPARLLTLMSMPAMSTDHALVKLPD